MKLILSPTKTMAVPVQVSLGTPQFEQEAYQLIRALGPLDFPAVRKLFKTSDALTRKTCDQIREFDSADSGPAVFAFQGEAFKTLSPEAFTREQLEFANTHLRIFSGLYGVVCPLDRIKPYRLDFNTPLKIDKVSLKAFWQKRLIPYFEALLAPEEHLINLASDEYSSVLSSDFLKRKIIGIQFRERVDGKLKNLSVRAKQARGAFAAHIIKNSITRPDELQQICVDGYRYEEDHSSHQEWFFIR